MYENQVPIDYYTLSVLLSYYEENPYQSIPAYDLYCSVYYQIEQDYQNFNLSEQELYPTLEYLIEIGFVRVHVNTYQITGQGRAYLLNPRGSSLALDQRNVEIAENSLDYNRKMFIFAVLSLVVAILSFFVAWAAISAR